MIARQKKWPPDLKKILIDLPEDSVEKLRAETMKGYGELVEIEAETDIKEIYRSIITSGTSVS